MLKVKLTQPQVNLTMDMRTAEVLRAIVRTRVSTKDIMELLDDPMLNKADTEAIIGNIQMQLEAI